MHTIKPVSSASTPGHTVYDLKNMVGVPSFEAAVTVAFRKVAPTLPVDIFEGNARVARVYFDGGIDRYDS